MNQSSMGSCKRTITQGSKTRDEGTFLQWTGNTHRGYSYLTAGFSLVIEEVQEVNHGTKLNRLGYLSLSVSNICVSQCGWVKEPSAMDMRKYLVVIIAAVLTALIVWQWVLDLS